MNEEAVVKKIYVQVQGVPEPTFVILHPDGQVVRTPYIAIDGPSELVHDPALGKYIVLTSSPIRITRDL